MKNYIEKASLSVMYNINTLIYVYFLALRRKMWICPFAFTHTHTHINLYICFLESFQIQIQLY